MEIGRILKYYRALHNLTQSEVAELSGINEKYLGRIERDESVPTIDKVEQLCLAFDIRICDLLMVSPDKISVHTQHSDSRDKSLVPYTIYYCNCCGCAFQASQSEIDSNSIRCPECDCLFDSDNGYIEKNTMY